MIRTARLTLTLESADAARTMIDQLPADVRREVSESWIAQIRSATEATPWLHGFRIGLRSVDEGVGNCGYKGPPDADGTVEIAYAIRPEHRGLGFATEAAAALTEYAFQNGAAHVIAHTLPEPGPSARVLEKAGFACVGEVIDPDDGPVWRWKRDHVAGSSA